MFTSFTVCTKGLISFTCLSIRTHVHALVCANLHKVSSKHLHLHISPVLVGANLHSAIHTDCCSHHWIRSGHIQNPECQRFNCSSAPPKKWESKPGGREDTILIGVLYLDENPLLLLHIPLWEAGCDEGGHWERLEWAMTRFKDEVRSYCKSQTNLKVVKWG